MVENPKLYGSEFLEGVPGVDFWSQRCLPFPKKNEEDDLVSSRKELQQAIKNLPAPEDGMILHATLQTPHVDERFDLENKLIYNVGTGAFKQATRHGIWIERQRINTEPSRPYVHQYRFEHPFEPATREDLLTFAFELKRLNGRIKPITIWVAAVQALMELEMPSSTHIPEEGRFQLSIELTTPTNWSGNLAALMKPLLDGIISALHSTSDVPDEVIFRMEKAAVENAAQLKGLLVAKGPRILGKRDLVQCWGESFRWNPADDRCDWCRILLKRNGPVPQGDSVHCKVSVGAI